MRLALMTTMLGVAALLGGCANRLPTATQDTTQATAPGGSYGSHYVVVRTTSRPVTTARNVSPTRYPAPPPPASVQLVRGPQTLPAARRIVIAPRGRRAHVQPALSVPSVPTQPRKVQPAPSPCLESALFAPQKDCVFDPCDPCAGGRCSVPK